LESGKSRVWGIKGKRNKKKEGKKTKNKASVNCYVHSFITVEVD
jgi:hypothetical protein